MADTTKYVCPVCDHEPLLRLDIPKFNIYQCDECKEVVQQLQNKSFVPVGELLRRNELGDDRVRAATSAPHVSTVRSFLDIHDGSARMLEFQMAEARGGLRTVLAQLENRIDFALAKFTGLDFANDDAAAALAALREARDLCSVTPARNRGVPSKGPDDVIG